MYNPANIMMLPRLIPRGGNIEEEKDLVNKRNCESNVSKSVAILSKNLLDFILQSIILLSMKFIDREEEIKKLKEFQGKGLVLLYGRRRVGKTTLLKMALPERETLYYQCARIPKEIMYRELTGILGQRVKEPVVSSFHVKTFEDFLLLFERHMKGKNLVIDEVGYLFDADPSFSSMLQRFVDRRGKNIGIYLSGSTVGIIERELSSRAPLWGRFDLVLELKPLRFKHFVEYIGKDTPFRKTASLYAILGGVPYHWERVPLKRNLFEVVREGFLSPHAPLYNEVEFLLREELREIHNYFAILSAIASGRRKHGEIADVSGVPVQSLSKYLEVLEKLGWIEGLRPAGERKRRALWYIKDNLFRFWFRYVFPHRHMIEMGMTDKVLEIIKNTWEMFMGEAYERIAIEVVEEMIKEGILPPVQELGRWWNKKVEVDILGLNEKKEWVIAGEVKWGYFSSRDLAGFMEKIKALPFRKSRDAKILLFSGKGFRCSLPKGVMGIKGDRIVL